MAAKNWTDEQKACIESRDGTLLVSAAAGSGKTSVLVERVIRRVTDENSPVDIDRLLIVTFTSAAAAEMKQRLAATLAARISEEPENIHLQRQQMLLARAQISTVHSFCLSLIKDHFHILGLPPQFRTGETAEISQIQEQALEEVIEEMYREDSPEFIELANLLSPGKSDYALFDAVRKIHTFIQSHPYPEKWLDEKLEEYYTNLPLEQTRWGKVLLEKAHDVLIGASFYIRRALELSDQDPKMAEKYSESLRREYAMLQNAAKAVLSNNWDVALVSAGGITFGTLPQLRKYPDTARKERVQDLRKRAKAEIDKKLKPLFCGTEEECRDDIKYLSVLVKTLFEVVKRFEARFAELKLAKGVADYSDLEHMALKLLIDENGERTELAKEISQRFEEVLVDEYQDTNAAQDALFRAVSRDETNLFMVGDVKQSIYGFRQAMPEIFLNRRNSYPAYDGKNYPASITLGHNFRSRTEVTDAVNFVFRQLMTKSVSGMDYDKQEELIASAKYPESAGYEAELLIIDKASVQKPDSADAAEARLIAERIREIMDTLTVTEGSEQRKPRYRDFCILLRSNSAHAKAYSDGLALYGIPAITDAVGGFYSAPEVASAIALLNVIDNPMQDVPLLSVLLSPAFGFTPDQLAEIRVNDPDSGLYTALCRYGKTGADENLRKQVQSFLSQIEKWRLLAVTMPADLLIHRIYEDAALMSIAAAMKNGEQRQANLRILHERARSFEHNGFRGLSAFVRMLNREIESGEQGPQAALASQDAVRIMSIHSSKGLEFPFVFVAGLGNPFNKESSNDNLLLHIDMGIGFKRRDFETMRQWNTLPRLAVSHTITKSYLAEEQRVLYVAMTRAREKLIMVMTVPNIYSKLSSLSALVGSEDRLPSSVVMGAGGMCDWLLAAALRHPSGKILRSLAGDEDIPKMPADHPWIIKILPAPEKLQPETAETVQVEPDMDFAEIIRQRISYTYPFAALSAVPAKLAASDLSSGKVTRENIAKSRPAFLSEGGLTPAERGTALHTFMQFADYEAASTEPEAEINRLVKNGYLTPEQGRVIPLDKLKKFFESSLYQRFKNADNILREVQFTMDFPVKSLLDIDLPDACQDESLVVQGIADCVIVENGTLTVVDYKTDFVKSGETLVERYREQLRIYSLALQQALGMPVKECLLYSFSLDAVVDATRIIMTSRL